MDAVELNRVRFERSGVAVLDGVDLSVATGERMALLGASGAGKTTVLRLIAGLDSPSSGSVEVWGRAVNGPRPDVAMVFQPVTVYDHLDVEANLSLPLQLGDAEGDVDATGRRFTIRGLFARRTDSLSAGQRALVGAARAVVREGVRLVLLDEVLVTADPERRRRLVETVMADSSVTIVFASNDPSDVFRYADRVAVVHDGRIRQVDTPDAVYRRPASLPVATLMGEVNRFPATIRMEGGVRLEIGGSRLRMDPPASVGEGHRVVAAIRPHDLESAGPATPFEQVLHGTVGRIEHIGGSVRVLFGIGDIPGVAFAGVVARPSRAVGVGDRCRWRVRTDRVVLFDPGSGHRL